MTGPVIDERGAAAGADELLRRFAAAIRSAQLYAASHPIVTRNVEALTRCVEQMLERMPVVTLGIVGTDLVVAGVPIDRADVLAELIRRLVQAGIERVTFERGVTTEETRALVRAVAAGDRLQVEGGDMPHIRIGRIEMTPQALADLADMATVRRLYAEAVTVATRVWESAATEGRPDATSAREMIDGLAEAVAQNRTALTALTALKNYDNYTFTHMVNVSILTMGQARGLGIDGPLLREMGMAALMHDIGKVRTPAEILNKPEALTDDEFTIMKRHTVDGAEILRQTPDIPALAPVVAFEHHLRLDGSGYPDSVRRPSLNVATMLCSIADVYDAMRSQRGYQQAFPTARILEVLKRNDGRQFDPNLVRRFVQLVGIYPPGNLVRLSTGEIAVVLKTHAPDPHRPRVRIVFDSSSERLERPYDVNLWDPEEESTEAPSIVSPLDPASVGIDPLALM